MTIFYIIINIYLYYYKLFSLSIFKKNICYIFSHKNTNTCVHGNALQNCYNGEKITSHQ